MFGHKLFSVEARNKHCSISRKSSLGGGCSQWWHSQFVPCWRKQPGVLGAGASPPGGTSIAAQAHPKPLVSPVQLHQVWLFPEPLAVGMGCGVPSELQHGGLLVP